MPNKLLDIIYQDEHLVAINKPNGLLVHRTYLASREDTFALQLLRNQLRQHVHLVHRLDRKTSGVLLFALDPNTTKLLQKEFLEQRIQKKYIAIVRGYFPDEIEVDYPLKNERGKIQEAITRFKTVKRSEIAVPFGKHNTSRYSLIEAYPQTGRQHQIRKHCNHLRHPIIGDRPHGCNKQNRLFKERWNMTTMLLHALELQIKHPFSGEILVLKARLPLEFTRMKAVLNF